MDEHGGPDGESLSFSLLSPGQMFAREREVYREKRRESVVGSRDCFLLYCISTFCIFSEVSLFFMRYGGRKSFLAHPKFYRGKIGHS